MGEHGWRYEIKKFLLGAIFYQRLYFFIATKDIYVGKRKISV